METNDNKTNVGVVLVPENEYMNRLLAFAGSISDSLKDIATSLNELARVVSEDGTENVHPSVTVRIMKD